MTEHVNDTNEIGPEQSYRNFLAAGRFMLQRSRETGEHVYYARVATPGSGRRDLEWVEASGKGTVYATTVARQRPEKGGDYNIALIDLEEGPRMMSRVSGIAPTEVRIGMAVQAHIEHEDGEPLVVFTPAEGG